MITGNNDFLIKQFREDINKKYKITDLGPVFSLLGIKVTWDLVEKTISLSQQAYIEAIITKFNFDDLKPSSTPMDPCAPLSKSQSPTKLEDIAKMRNVPYREAVGSLMYTAMGARPDITFAMLMVAQYSENPGWKHWEAVKRIFHYLLGTKKVGIDLWRGGERSSGVHGHRWGIARPQKSHFWLCIYGRQRGYVLVFQEARISNVINNRSRVRCRYSCCQRSHMASLLTHRTL